MCTATCCAVGNRELCSRAVCSARGGPRCSCESTPRAQEGLHVKVGRLWEGHGQVMWIHSLGGKGTVRGDPTPPRWTPEARSPSLTVGLASAEQQWWVVSPRCCSASRSVPDEYQFESQLSTSLPASCFMPGKQCEMAQLFRPLPLQWVPDGALAAGFSLAWSLVLWLSLPLCNSALSNKVMFRKKQKKPGSLDSTCAQERKP